MPNEKLGKPLTTRLDEKIEELLRADAAEQKRTLAALMRIMLTESARRPKK